MLRLGHSIKALLVFFALSAALSSCGNTIRGLGRDTANMVDATKDAGEDVAHSM